MKYCETGEPRQLAISIHSLAAFGVVSSPDVSRIVATFVAKLDAASERDASMMLSALARLGWRENVDLIVSVQQHALKLAAIEGKPSMPDALLTTSHTLDLHISSDDVAMLLNTSAIRKPRQPRVIPNILRAAAHYGVPSGV